MSLDFKRGTESMFWISGGSQFQSFEVPMMLRQAEATGRWMEMEELRGSNRRWRREGDLTDKEG